MQKVSVGTARDPRWNADGSELYFLGLQPRQTSTADEWSLFAAGIQPNENGGLDIGLPQELFPVHTNKIVSEYNVWSYAPHTDGRRFLVNKSIDPGQPNINVITHWRPAPGE
jgi:hypothetical protein